MESREYGPDVPRPWDFRIRASATEENRMHMATNEKFLCPRAAALYTVRASLGHIALKPAAWTDTA